ncbi:MAG: hypothetical protein VCD00_12935 [Candidatus Hydrogenedentota bacterium]
MMIWFRRIVMLGVFAILLTPRTGWACATCFGAEGDPQTEGLNMAIITLLGVTYTLFSVMALAAFLIWKKNQKAMQDEMTDAMTDAVNIQEASTTHG